MKGEDVDEMNELIFLSSWAQKIEIHQCWTQTIQRTKHTFFRILHYKKMNWGTEKKMREAWKENERGLAEGFCAGGSNFTSSKIFLFQINVLNGRQMLLWPSFYLPVDVHNFQKFFFFYCNFGLISLCFFGLPTLRNSSPSSSSISGASSATWTSSGSFLSTFGCSSFL